MIIGCLDQRNQFFTFFFARVLRFIHHQTTKKLLANRTSKRKRVNEKFRSQLFQIDTLVI
jgi:hypothetical protein